MPLLSFRLEPIYLPFFIADEEIDAAVVCTENLTHEDFAAQLLSAGKHVIVEYPAALSDKGTRRLFQIAEVHD